ncbi:4-hydroxythreonine-4-phosphate dehydrogenase PdxA [Polaromonas naphthalenivorans]|uniref:4-hydroxythreonine-4-phosphate dehydrogenase n=1 Tax=Polaromonas naphthalenivorans (strain CJ2) TaxID=365044 RepID=A1VK52_POLNA|nr:4-hydroxythreonine-4-phosphate dehydrogenase PdxA [Polaromonas naphthalenivorans]ABM36030.1 4-hydroxythreonine-4-phosphate dehydrogenase [Polaromonas naphthalenivorans CJ2]
MKKPILITMGDAAGIGPEIIARAFRDSPDDLAGCVVVGDVATLRRASALIAAKAGVLALPVAQLDSLADVLSVPPNCIGVLQKCELSALVPYGQISALAGQAAADCIVWAARAVLAGQAAAMVTAPIHKEALAAAGGWAARFPGHTEMLQAEAAAFLGKPVSEVPVRMMLANDELKTVLVSIHMSLRNAIEAVTFDSVLQTLRITHTAVSASLGRPPRIAVAGLNPHAGEGGLFGSEEQAIIAPAIAAAVQEGLDARGPFAPDTVFMRARSAPAKPGEFDVVVAMYHDQGLIPVKYLGVEQGVNVTLGLPLVRTSPDHGTAFDIAGTSQADASSLLAAIRMARHLAV